MVTIRSHSAEGTVFFFAERAARAAGTGVSVNSRIPMAGLSSDPCQRQGWGSSGLGRVPAFPNRTQLVGNCRTLGQAQRGALFVFGKGDLIIVGISGILLVAMTGHDWTEMTWQPQADRQPRLCVPRCAFVPHLVKAVRGRPPTHLTHAAIYT